MSLTDKLIIGFKRSLISGLMAIALTSCSGNGEDSSVSGCTKNDDCMGNRVCIEGVCVENEETDIYQPETNSSEKCDPNHYLNSCDELILSYCDANTYQVKKLDCEEQGFFYCGYADFIEKSICYGSVGNRGFGQHCSTETKPGDKTLLQSECDFTIVDVCAKVDYVNEPYSICTTLCKDSSECPEGAPEYYTCYPLNEGISEEPGACKPHV